MAGIFLVGNLEMFIVFAPAILIPEHRLQSQPNSIINQPCDLASLSLSFLISKMGIMIVPQKFF